MTEGKHDLVLAAPPVGVGALTILNVTLADWVLLLTLVYTLVLLIDKLPVVFRRARELYLLVKEWRNGRN